MKRLFLSALLAFHLFGVIAAPNAGSYFYDSVAWIYRPYLSSIGLAGIWSFFAPEPVVMPVFIDYVIEFSDKEAIRGRYPDDQNPYFFRDRFNRRVAMAAFMTSAESNWQNMLVHYLCEQNKGASDIKLWKLHGEKPSFEMVRNGTHKLTDVIDFKIEVLGTYYCTEDKNAPSP